MIRQLSSHQYSVYDCSIFVWCVYKKMTLKIENLGGRILSDTLDGVINFVLHSPCYRPEQGIHEFHHAAAATRLRIKQLGRKRNEMKNAKS